MFLLLRFFRILWKIDFKSNFCVFYQSPTFSILIELDIYLLKGVDFLYNENYFIQMRNMNVLRSFRVNLRKQRFDFFA